MVWSYWLNCESSRETPQRWYLVASVCFYIESAIREIIPTSAESCFLSNILYITILKNYKIV